MLTVGTRTYEVFSMFGKLGSVLPFVVGADDG